MQGITFPPLNKLEHYFDGFDVPEKYEQSWAEWFCSLEANHFATVVPSAYLRDEFNWVRIRGQLRLSKERYSAAQKIVLGSTIQTSNQDASDMYALLHARYLNSPQGLAILY